MIAMEKVGLLAGVGKLPVEFMLQVIVIALFFGGAIMAAGEKGKLCRDIVSSFNEVINRLMAFIISLSPIGVFTMMAWVVATQGAQILGSLALVLLCAYIAYILHAVKAMQRALNDNAF